MANFEALRWIFSSSTNLLFLKCEPLAPYYIPVSSPDVGGIELDFWEEFSSSSTTSKQFIAEIVKFSVSEIKKKRQ